MNTLIPVCGIGVFFFACWIFSSQRRAIDWRSVGGGMALQVFFAFSLLGIPSLGLQAPLGFVFEGANNFVNSVLNSTLEGSRFLFGDLVQSEKMGFIFAFQVLPTIIFMASLTSVLYFIGFMQRIVQGLAWVMFRAMRISGAEALSVAADIFLGQTEAPLVIKPYLPRMTRSELFAVMSGGMATVAGGVMAAYVGLLRDQIPNIAGHLLAASVITAPASIWIAKLLVPEEGKPETLGELPKEKLYEQDAHANLLDAAASGASEGLRLAVNVGAMLLAFIALISLMDGFLSWISQKWITGSESSWSLSLILGWIFQPVAFLIGVPWSEAQTAGALLGKKLVLNEFIAYLDLAQLGPSLSDRTRIILSYALCGFANFSSIAIQIGGIGGLAPNRRRDIARLGLKAVLGGSLATLVTAALAAILV